MARAGWMLLLLFCCLVCRWEPPWAPPEARAPSEQGGCWGQRGLLWLLSLAGFSGLVWLLDDFRTEPCAAQGEATETDCSLGPAPHCRCTFKATVKSLSQLERDLVVLLYKLRKQKGSLAASWLSPDPGRQPPEAAAAQGSHPPNLVIYTIQEDP